ncbi:MAG: LLM class flavin-dependent oxidoreductase [Actinobacteria bacterium]|nr:LLM class flavin-dependent oxidoreductase [Actinomycetota bacterium]
MRCGAVLPGGTATEQPELGLLAEQAGWDGVFAWEAAYGPDPWSMLGAMPVHTSQIRLGTMLIPQYRIAESADDPAAAVASVREWANAGCPWWLEIRWTAADHMRQRIAAGPPREPVGAQ